MSDSDVRILRDQLAKTRAQLAIQARELEQLRFFREVAELQMESQPDPVSQPPRKTKDEPARRSRSETKLKTRIKDLETRVGLWKEKYVATVDSISVAILVADFQTTTYTEANKAACLLFGYSAEEFKRMNGRMLSPSSAHDRVDELARQIRSTGSGFAPSLLFQRHDRGTFYGEVRAKVFQVGAKEFLITAIRNVTHESADPTEIIHEMTRGAAQQVEPLAVKLSSALTALETGRRNPKRYFEALRKVQADLLGLSRRLREACCDTALTIETLPLRKPIEAALNQLVPEMQKDGISIRGRHQPGLPEIDGDLTELTRAFGTLIHDAWDALKEIPVADRAVEVGTRSLGEKVAARVWFSGPSLTEAEQKALFRPFHAAESLHRAAAKGIIEAHGGSLEVDVPRSGGVAYLVTLPKR